jgi:peptidoglycan/LPS O-acetylase OafA/YrhL
VQHNLAYNLVTGGGIRGVEMFFVISGYLITSLLIREFEKTGSIAIGRFYFRRTLRIFPAFYVFMGTIFLLTAFGKIEVDRASAIAAATYTWALYPNVHSWIIGHTWSLSIEEFFYLFWPVLFLYSYRRNWKLRTPVFLILIMPFIRLAIFIGPAMLDGREPHRAQYWIDTMMIGCLLAILESVPAWKEFRRRRLNGLTVSILAFFAFFAIPYVPYMLPKNPARFYDVTFANPLTAICMAGIMIYMIEHEHGYVGRILNTRWLKHIGVMSYSLYLWQQIFVFQDLHLLPWGIVGAFACGELSFWLIEKPALNFRARLEKRLFRTVPIAI